MVPDLAEAKGVATDGGKTWTYKLKRGVKYEDGTEIKAKDIKYAVGRTFDRAVLHNGPSYFPQLLDAEGYKGAFKDKNLDNFKGVEVPDDYTVVFKLKAPFSEFDQVVGFSGQTAPVPADKDKGIRYGMHPVSSGPYKLEGDYQPKKGGTLVRNPNWDPATDPNRKQLPDKIEVQSGLKAEEIDSRVIMRHGARRPAGHRRPGRGPSGDPDQAEAQGQRRQPAGGLPLVHPDQHQEHPEHRVP